MIPAGEHSATSSTISGEKESWGSLSSVNYYIFTYKMSVILIKTYSPKMSRTYAPKTDSRYNQSIVNLQKRCTKLTT